MNNSRSNRKKLLIAPLAAVCLFALLLTGLPFFRPKAPETPQRPEAHTGLTSGAGLTTLSAQSSSGGQDAPEGESAGPALSHARGKIRISEIMVKNHATLMDELGGFPDWVELENCSDELIDLSGFRIAEEPGGSGWSFPALSLAPGEYLLVYADGKSMKSPVIHADFSLSEGEWVYIYDADGLEVDSAECACGEADFSLVRSSSGNFELSMLASPGYPNDDAGYIRWQESLTAMSPLRISEVMVYNDSYLQQKAPVGSVYCDWVELRNMSGGVIELSDYYLSDDEDLPTLWQLPAGKLRPGERYLVLCAKNADVSAPSLPVTDFELSSDGEQLFLSQADGSIADFVFIPDVPYGCSYGRVDRENGWFYMDAPSPGTSGERGARLVSSSPKLYGRDGIFDGVDSVTVELSSPGIIRYTTDGSLPTAQSPVWREALRLSSTTVIRAVAMEEGKLPSRPLNLSFIINEGHSLPVMSLVSDDPAAFKAMYSNRRKDIELPGALAFYEGESGFILGCGIEMHGQTSLELPKKNMSVRFRAAYGQAELDYDVFGGGVTEFTNFVLRSGHDFTGTIVRNELLQNLGLQMGPDMLNQRSRHCVLYINGTYSGLYTLTEKLNESHYAKHAIVSKDSVTVEKAPIDSRNAFYEVIRFAQSHDLSQSANYEQFCRMVDMDSLIDWMIIEGYSANTDIVDSNVRFCRSDENDGRWRLMLYDMDATLDPAVQPFANVLRPATNPCADFIAPLMRNPEFRHRFLVRAAEVLSTVLTNENVIAELDRLAALVAADAVRDYARFNMPISSWEGDLRTLRRTILDNNRQQRCIDAICQYFMLSPAERAQYFGQ